MKGLLFATLLLSFSVVNFDVNSMDNPWISSTDSDDISIPESDGIFMGIFNRPPAEIARSLPRPINPDVKNLLRLQNSYSMENINSILSRNQSNLITPSNSYTNFHGE